MSNVHAFSVSLATRVGLNESILLQHFWFWHQNNQGKPDRCFDGHVWSFNPISRTSKKSSKITPLVEIFPYLSKKKIEGAIARLIDMELLVSGNYNEHSFDRTKWYALTFKGVSLFVDPKGEMQVQKGNSEVQKGNSEVQNALTIPNSNNNSNNNSNKEYTPKPPEGDEIEVEVLDPCSFSSFWNTYSKKVGDKQKIERKWNKLSKAEKQAVMDHLKEYIPSTPNLQYRKNPQTYLNNKSWNDEIITTQNTNGKSNGSKSGRGLSLSEMAQMGLV